MGSGRQHRSVQLIPGALRLRLAVWYALAIGSLGALHPLLASSLLRSGLDAAVVPLLLTAFPLGTLLAGPTLGRLADRSGRLDLLLRTTAVLSALAAAAFALELPPAGLVVALGALALFRAPLFPLVDALVVDLLGAERRRYGALRAWGSVAFIALVQIAGAWLVVEPRAPRILAAGCLAGCALLAFALPPPPADAAAALRVLPSRDGGNLSSLWLVATLIGCATAMYDFLFVVHIESIGGDARMAGVAIGAGVALEVAVMATSPRWLPRLRPTRGIQLAAAAGVARWILSAALENPVQVAAVQVLHGLSFGVFWVSAIALIGERTPARMRASATGALLATSAGVGPLLAMVLASGLLPRYGTRSLFIVAAFCGAGALIVASRRLSLSATLPPSDTPANV